MLKIGEYLGNEWKRREKPLPFPLHFQYFPNFIYKKFWVSEHKFFSLKLYDFNIEKALMDVAHQSFYNFLEIFKTTVRFI